MDEGTNGIMADTLIAGTTLVEKESRSVGDVPIGAVIAWLKNFNGVPNLSENFRECDGSTIVDALSPLNGQTLPDLNGDNRFLRGNSTSGATGGSSTVAHTHAGPSHSHSLGSNGYAKLLYNGSNNILYQEKQYAGDGLTGRNMQFNTNSVTSVSTTANRGVELGGDTNSGGTGNTGGASNTENKPPYYNVVWIMRIR